MIGDILLLGVGFFVGVILTGAWFLSRRWVNPPAWDADEYEGDLGGPER